MKRHAKESRNMADPLEPHGFWSYSRDDDKHSSGRLSQLRILLQTELAIFSEP